MDDPEELGSSTHSRAVAPMNSQWGDAMHKTFANTSQIRSQDGVGDEHKFLLLTVELSAILASGKRKGRFPLSVQPLINSSGTSGRPHSEEHLGSTNGFWWTRRHKVDAEGKGMNLGRVRRKRGKYDKTCTKSQRTNTNY